MWGNRSRARRTVRWLDLRPYKLSSELSLVFDLSKSPFNSNNIFLLRTKCLLTALMAMPVRMYYLLWH